MKPSIQLRLGQHLTLTPQLQQAIRLLQLSTLELEAEVQEALETNPMLEREVSEDTSPSFQTVEDNTPQSEDNYASDEVTEAIWENAFETPRRSLSHDANAESMQGSSDNLQDHLLAQVDVLDLSNRDRYIAYALIDALDEDGYLRANLRDIQESFHFDEPLELMEIDTVLQLIQHFEPAGVGARTLQECLYIQLKALPEDMAHAKEALIIVKEHFGSLSDHNCKSIVRKTHFHQDSVGGAISLIQNLEPRPGSCINEINPQYTVPDVIVKKVNGQWQASLNSETTPILSINQQYAAMIPQVKSSNDQKYMKEQLREARWLIKSLLSRNDTLMKVTQCILERQRGFFEYGEEAMRPMVLNDVAEAIDMHESTVSRVTTNKYMYTPRGVFQLKYFFSSHLSTNAGGECSSTAIRALVKKLVAQENPVKPLSDNKIALFLKDQGINVARRTIAKYRDALAIPPSNERRRRA